MKKNKIKGTFFSCSIIQQNQPRRSWRFCMKSAGSCFPNCTDFPPHKPFSPCLLRLSPSFFFLSISAFLLPFLVWKFWLVDSQVSVLSVLVILSWVWLQRLSFMFLLLMIASLIGSWSNDSSKPLPIKVIELSLCYVFLSHLICFHQKLNHRCLGTANHSNIKNSERNEIFSSFPNHILYLLFIYTKIREIKILFVTLN